MPSLRWSEKQHTKRCSTRTTHPPKKISRLPATRVLHHFVRMSDIMRLSACMASSLAQKALITLTIIYKLSKPSSKHRIPPLKMLRLMQIYTLTANIQTKKGTAGNFHEEDAFAMMPLLIHPHQSQATKCRTFPDARTHIHSILRAHQSMKTSERTTTIHNVVKYQKIRAGKD